MYIVIFSLIVGIIAAVIVGLVKAIRRRKPVGVLRIDASDPDGPYMFLELSEDISAVMDAEQVTLKVDTRGYISQK